MLDKQDISIIKGMMDAQSEEFTKKLDAQGASFTHQLNLLVENYFEPKFKLLAEGHQVLLETMAPKSRVEALEDEVVFMKQVIKAMSQDIAELKKAQ